MISLWSGRIKLQCDSQHKAGHRIAVKEHSLKGILLQLDCIFWKNIQFDGDKESIITSWEKIPAIFSSRLSLSDISDISVPCSLRHLKIHFQKLILETYV